MVARLKDVDITHQLATRESTPCDPRAADAALGHIEALLDESASAVFNASVQAAMNLCAAETCGISIKEMTSNGDEVFRWVALAGVLKGHVHGTTPRRYSPCGITVDAGKPLLMRRPERFYTYLDVGVPIYEALLVPLDSAGSSLEGTIWVISHDHRLRFHIEHTRVMQRIGILAAAAAVRGEARAPTSH